MDSAPIYPTTQPALVLGHLTLPIALRHLGMDCEADDIESSPETMRKAAEFMANIAETVITREEFISMMTFIKPLIQFLFFKELARLSPEYYGWLESVITERFAPSITNILNEGNTPAFLRNMMGGGENEDFEAIRSRILEWKAAVLDEESAEVIKPIEIDIKKRIAAFERKYSTKVKAITFDRSRPDSANDLTYANAVIGRLDKKVSTCKTIADYSFRGIIFAGTLTSLGVIGSIVSGENYRRLRDTATIERNAALKKIEIQKGVCVMTSSSTSTKVKEFMAGYSSCDVAFDPIKGNIEINTSTTLSAYLAANPMMYLNDIPFLNAYCTEGSAPVFTGPNSTGTTGTTGTNASGTAEAPGFSGALCNFPLGRLNPTLGAVAVQRYVTNAFTVVGAPTQEAAATAAAAAAEVETSIKNLVTKARAAPTAAKSRITEVRKEAEESRTLNLSFWGSLLTMGGAIATGAGALFGTSGTLGMIGRVVGMGGSALSKVGSVIPGFGNSTKTKQLLNAPENAAAEAQHKSRLAALKRRSEMSKAEENAANAEAAIATRRAARETAARTAPTARTAAAAQQAAAAANAVAPAGGRRSTRRRAHRKLRKTRKQMNRRR